MLIWHTIQRCLIAQVCGHLPRVFAKVERSHSECLLPAIAGQTHSVYSSVLCDRETSSDNVVLMQVWQTEYALGHCKLNNLGARYSPKAVRHLFFCNCGCSTLQLLTFLKRLCSVSPTNNVQMSTSVRHTVSIHAHTAEGHYTFVAFVVQANARAVCR